MDHGITKHRTLVRCFGTCSTSVTMSTMNLKQKLYAWRDAVAEREGVEGFRVLPNSSLDELVLKKPRTRDAMLEIKGIKDRKFAKYGSTLMAMIIEGGGNEQREEVHQSDISDGERAPIPEHMSVSAYLDLVNEHINALDAAIVGEISSFDSRASYCFFTLKDKDDESAISCFMWMRDFELAGIEASAGMEVLVRGAPEVYKPSGRMTFRARSIELVGEGALRKAYDALRKKLDHEGLFAPERKRMLPEFPERIGIITSKQGAVIHDLLNNIGAYGLSLELIDSRVEGMLAVTDIVRAIRAFRERNIDLLIVIRGGGSLESLQAFNNEHIVRAISDFPAPVICAIGHDKDVPLACLAADAAPSTPTAAAVLATRGWKDAQATLAIATRDMTSQIGTRLAALNAEVVNGQSVLLSALHEMRVGTERLVSLYREGVVRLEESIETKRQFLETAGTRISSLGLRMIDRERKTLETLERALIAHDPKRIFALGYSILEKAGAIVRNAKDLKNGDTFRAELSGGTIDATVTHITLRP